MIRMADEIKEKAVDITYVGYEVIEYVDHYEEYYTYNG